MAITFARSTDYALITRLLTDPRCWRRMADDSAPERSEFQAGPREGLEYIVATDGDLVAAVFLLLEASGGTEVHFCFAPRAWGNSERISREFLAWVWANTAHARLIGKTPARNRLALRLALAAGFARIATRNAVIVTELHRPLSQ